MSSKWVRPTIMECALPPSVPPGLHQALMLMWVEGVRCLRGVCCVPWTWVVPRLHGCHHVVSLTWPVSLNADEQKCGNSARWRSCCSYAASLTSQGRFLWGAVGLLSGYADIFLICDIPIYTLFYCIQWEFSDKRLFVKSYWILFKFESMFE